MLYGIFTKRTLEGDPNLDNYPHGSQRRASLEEVAYKEFAKGSVLHEQNRASRAIVHHSAGSNDTTKHHVRSAFEEHVAVEKSRFIRTGHRRRMSLAFRCNIQTKSGSIQPLW